MKLRLLIGLLMVCIIGSFLITSCSTGDKTSTLYGKDDPFKETGVESEIFEIDGSRDTIITAVGGTTVIIPAGSLEKEGKSYKGKIKVELAEAYSIADIVRTGLSTESSDGKLLESRGMAYVAFSDGEKPLSSSSKIKPRVEMPVKGDWAKFSIYKGTRGEKGVIKWGEPEKPKIYLNTVPASELDFLPDDFADSCRINFQLLGFKRPDMEDFERLYASLHNWNSGAHYDNYTATLNEDILTGRHHVNGIYLVDSMAYRHDGHERPSNCAKGKKWAAIVLEIKSKKLENTFFHTKSMEERIRYMIRENKTELIAEYWKAMDKDLWLIDASISSRAAALGLSNAQAARFQQFADQKLTNVKNIPHEARRLSSIFNSQVALMEKEVSRLSDQFSNAIKAKIKPSEKLVNEYKEVLTRRETYRMTKLGFEFRDNGWYNVDKPVEFPLTGTGGCSKYIAETKVQITNPDVADRCFTYIFFEDIYSMARLQESGRAVFHTAGLAMNVFDDCKRKLKFISFGIKNKQWFIGEREITIDGAGKTEKIKLNEITESEFKERMSTLEKFANYSGDFNSVKKDLEYQVKFYDQFKKTMKNRRKYDLLDNLEYLGNAFCYSKSEHSENRMSEENKKISKNDTTIVDFVQMDAESVFVNNCRSCHGLETKSTGPPLRKIHDKRPVGWLVKYIQNNYRLMQAGEPWSISVYNEYGKSNMTAFENLSQTQIKKLIWFLDHVPEGYKLKAVKLPSLPVSKENELLKK